MKNLKFYVQQHSTRISPGNYQLGTKIQIPYRDFCGYIKTSAKLMGSDWIKQITQTELQIQQVIKRWCNAYVSTEIKGQHIPVIDWDGALHDKNLPVLKHLDENNIGYVIFHSTTDLRYWIFIDQLGTHTQCIKLMGDCRNKYSAGDPSYIHYQSQTKNIVVRAYPKFMDIPSLFMSSDPTKYTKNFKLWIDSFNQYWKEPHIQEVVDHFFVESL